MSINYSGVSLIGVCYEKLCFDVLTQYAKALVVEDFESSDEYKQIEDNYLNEDCEWVEDVSELIQDSLIDYFNENMFDTLEDWFGVGLIGNCFTGRFEYIGISIQPKMSGGYDEEIETFKKFINLEPELYSGVYVW